jgi:hypothetical protein
MTTIRKNDVVLGVVESAWATTAYLDGKLYDAGFNWSTKTTRDALHMLYEAGLVQRRDAGKGYEWRLKPVEQPLGQRVIGAADMTPVPAAAVELRDLSAQVARLAEQLATVSATPPAASSTEVFIGDDVPLGTLVPANRDLVDRIVKRAVYQTGKELLAVLDGWIEGARENQQAGVGRRDDDPKLFHADDIRVMVNDAMRLLGAPEHRLPQAGE